MVLMLGTTALISSKQHTLAKFLPNEARCFVEYYEVLAEPEWEMPGWQKIVLSLILARNQDQAASNQDCVKPVKSGRTTSSS